MKTVTKKTFVDFSKVKFVKLDENLIGFYTSQEGITTKQLYDAFKAKERSIESQKSIKITSKKLQLRNPDPNDPANDALEKANSNNALYIFMSSNIKQVNALEIYLEKVFGAKLIPADDSLTYKLDPTSEHEEDLPIKYPIRMQGEDILQFNVAANKQQRVNWENVRYMKLDEMTLKIFSDSIKASEILGFIKNRNRVVVKGKGRPNRYVIQTSIDSSEDKNHVIVKSLTNQSIVTIMENLINYTDRDVNLESPVSNENNFPEVDQNTTPINENYSGTANDPISNNQVHVSHAKEENFLYLGNFNDVPFFYSGNPEQEILITWLQDFPEVDRIVEDNIRKKHLQNLFTVSSLNANQLCLRLYENAQLKSPQDLSHLFEIFLTEEGLDACSNDLYNQARIYMGSFFNVSFFYEGNPEQKIIISWQGPCTTPIEDMIRKNITNAYLNNFFTVNSMNNNQLSLSIKHGLPIKIEEGCDYIFKMLLTESGLLEYSLMLNAQLNKKLINLSKNLMNNTSIYSNNAQNENEWQEDSRNQNSQQPIIDLSTPPSSPHYVISHSFPIFNEVPSPTSINQENANRNNPNENVEPHQINSVLWQERPSDEAQGIKRKREAANAATLAPASNEKKQHRP